MMALVQSNSCDSSSGSTEVILARELLDSLMSRTNAPITYPFMEEVDPEALGLKDYRKVVKEPMWLKKMAEKFSTGVYQNIRDFVCDFRLMLLNCYRYNGVSSRIGRLAEKLELLFEQKLQLMSQEIRAKTSIQATLGGGTAEEELADTGMSRRRSSSRLFLSGDSRQLTPMRAIMEELEHTLEPGTGLTATLITATPDLSKYASGNSLANLPSMQSLSTATTAEERVAIIVARLTHWNFRRQDEALLSSWTSWWTEQKGPELMDVVQNTQELLEIYQFLWLADPFLGLTDSLVYFTPHTPGADVNPAPARNLGLFDLELALAVAPRASLLLATCMSNLLATIKERGRIVAVLSTADGSTGDPVQDPAADTSGRRSRSSQNRVGSYLSPLEYDVWERRLAARVTSWYRALWDKGKGSSIWATRRLGLPPHFFHRCGIRQSPLESKRFHELPVYIRIQLFYALCETVLRTFDNLRVSMERDADWEAAAPVSLGEDLFSNVNYVYFPGLLNSTPATLCRVYRISRLKSGPVDLQQQNKSSPTPESEPVVSDKVGLEPPTVDSPAVFKVENSASSSSAEDIEPVEPALPVKASRGRRSRKRKFTHTKKHSQLETSIAEHDRLIAECGIDVPGPVRRLPRWIDPSLARSTCRRLYCIADQQQLTQASSVAAQEKSRGRKSAQLSRSSSTSSLLEQNLTARSAGNDQWPKSSAKIPLPAFQRLDNRKVAELTTEEPALIPSPFGTLCGMSHRYLSVQLSRSYYGTGVSKPKSANWRRIRARARAKKLREAAAPTSEQDEVASSAADVDDSAGSLPSSSSDGERQTGDEEEDEDDKSSGNANTRTKNEDGDVDEQEQEDEEKAKTSPESDDTTQSNHVKVAEKNTASNSSPTPNVEGEAGRIVKSEVTPMSDTESSSGPAEKPTEPEEPMITQPDRHEFSLVAYDSTSLQQLLTELRALLKTAQARVSNPDPSDAPSADKREGNSTSCMDTFRLETSDSFSSGTDLDEIPDKDVKSKRKTVSDGHKPLDRLRRGIRLLEQLIQNLEQLDKSMHGLQNERGDAQKLARLRLRKDVAAWQAKEDERIQKENEEARLEKERQQRQQQLAANPPELAKERAERLQRREMLRSIEYGHDSEDESDSGSHKSSPEYRPPGFVARYVPNSTKRPALSAGTTSPRFPPAAFRSRFDKSGSPKVPISRTAPTINQLSNHLAVGNIRPVNSVQPLNGPSNTLQARFSFPTRGPLTHTQPSFGVRFTGITPVRPVNMSHSTITQSNVAVVRPMLQTNSPCTTVSASTVTSSTPVTPTQLTNPNTSTNHVPASAPTHPTPPPRKIYRVYDTLFTENACPVRIDPDGTLHPLPLDSVPSHHRQVAVQMIARYKQHAAATGLVPSSTPKRVSVTTGDPDPT